MNDDTATRISSSTLFRFFGPMSLSACLATFSFLIINAALARSSDPQAALSSYAIAFSLYLILERPLMQLRQTSTAFVRDQRSFSAMNRVAVEIWLATLAAGMLLLLTPIGPALMHSLFRVERELVDSVLVAFGIMLFATGLSAMRSLYQGVLIQRRHTQWMTLGILLRIAVMLLLSWLTIRMGWLDGVSRGAILFLVGMAIEALVSLLAGRLLLARDVANRTAAVRDADKEKEIFRFYRPMLVSALLIVLISPAIQAMLGRSADATLALASYAVALSIFQLAQSFMLYTHQLVLNFYRINARLVRSFTACFSFIPICLLAGFAFAPAGGWMLQHGMGLSAEMADASLKSLRIFIAAAAIFPWLDYHNGRILLRAKTRWFMLSQSGNVAVTLSTLCLLVWMAPHWNGVIGALALTAGLAAELLIIGLAAHKEHSH